MKGRIWKCFLVCATFLCGNSQWGFFGHKHITELTVYTLHPNMIGFFKKHIDYLITNSVNPDRRRYTVEAEAPRHYIDLDLYGDSAIHLIPKYWQQAVKKFGKDTLEARGIVPWHIYRMYHRLKTNFMLYNPNKILRTATELGHYVSDANVPLHTTSNYNGQLTGQTGLHAFWESRLPELFFNDYDFFVGKASYINNVQSYAWQAVKNAHSAVDSIFWLEKQLAQKICDKKYNFETKGKKTVKTISRYYATHYHKVLHGMVERQMKSSIKMTGDLWYTAWVDAGQPNLDSLINYSPTKEELEKRQIEWQKWNSQLIKSRIHEFDTKQPLSP